jgi:hypothetical protein
MAAFWVAIESLSDYWDYFISKLFNNSFFSSLFIQSYEFNRISSKDLISSFIYPNDIIFIIVSIVSIIISERD